MANQAPAATRPRWYSAVWQAYKVTARFDKSLPWVTAAALAVPTLLGVLVGYLLGGYFGWILGPLTGLMVGVLLAVLWLTRRFESTMFKQMEGQMGGSLAVAQSIRTGWQFADEPIAVDAKTRAVVFQGVGNGGVVLLAEGGRAAKRTIDTTTTRLHKLVPGVPVTAIYVGKGQGETEFKDLTKAIRGTRRQHFGRGLTRGLSAADQDAVRARLRALGGPQLPIPKGIDPTRARADRKSLRGR